MNEFVKETRGNINFYNCDCIEFMKTKPDNYYDLAIVDPPYGIDIAKWDTKEHKPKPEYFEQLFRISKNQIIWGGNYFDLPHTDAWICWYKKPFLEQQAHFELAWTSFDMKSKMIEYTYAGNAEGLNKVKVDYKKKSIHEAQKPVNLYRILLNDYAEIGFKILDTHGGSHTHAIAAALEVFELDIIEIDEKYFNDGLNAFDEYKRQLKLF